MEQQLQMSTTFALYELFVLSFSLFLNVLNSLHYERHTYICERNIGIKELIIEWI